MTILACLILGGLSALIVEKTVFKKRPTEIPVFIDSAVPFSENRLNINPCIDLYSFVCMTNKKQDPSGFVKRDAEGEVEALRVMEKIIRTHKKITNDQLNTKLVEQIYTAERVNLLKDLFEDVRKNMLKFIDAQPFQALSLEERIILRKHVERVSLELPPPASLYADETELFTSNDVYYERTNENRTRIRIGGALLFTVKSKFNLAFTLAHELAHSIDPCELKLDQVDILAYHGLAECFGTPLTEQAGECRAHGRASEIFADWVATHIVADLLTTAATQYTKAQTKNALMNAVRDLCVEEEPYDDDRTPEDGKIKETPEELAASHPTSSFRVNHIFAQHPQIRKILGCQENQGPLLPGVPQQCFWKLSTE